MEPNSILHYVVPIVKSVGDFIRSAKISTADIQEKDINSLVTFVDKEAEMQLVTGLKKIMPEASFITEEQTIEPENKPWTWIIDPLDGTTNYIHGIPCFSISLALHFNEEPILGIVYEINQDEMFTAISGEGAFMNDLKIKVSRETELKNAVVATGFPYTRFDYVDSYMQTFKNFMMQTRGIRRFGSAAVDLCYVACGRFDGFFEQGLNVWDVAAGAVILKEAGGELSDFSNESNYLYGGEILGSNKHLHQQALKLISDT